MVADFWRRDLCCVLRSMEFCSFEGARQGDRLDWAVGIALWSMRGAPKK